jgi:competence protein ComEA
MFNFTKTETNAVFFVVIILLVSGVYQLISPTKSLQPSYDYSTSDSAFKRLSQEKPSLRTDTSQISQHLIKQKDNQPKPKKTKPTIKKDKLLPSSVNVNTASEKELQKLPRIGPSKAKLIVEYRNDKGKFKNIQELLEIKGIGKKTLEKLKPFIIIK